MWSLSIMILSEFGLSLFSCDHTFAHPFNEAVSLRIVFMCSWWKGWCLQGADRFYVNLCRCHGFFYFETDGFCWGWSHSSFSIWPRKIQISCVWVKSMQCMMCWVVSAGTSFQIVIHGQLQPTFLQRSFVGLRVHTGDWAGAKCPECQS